MGLFDRLFGNKKKEVEETVDNQSQEETLQEVVETSEQTRASSDTVKETVEVSEQAEIVNDTVEETPEVQDVVNVNGEAEFVETETLVQSENSETVVENTANQTEEISEATAVTNEAETDQHFSDVMADYYAKKAAAQEAIDRGETVTFEAVETRQETEPKEVVVQEATETEEEKYNRSLKKTRTGFSARLNAFLANFRRVDEEFFEELEEMLILSDVGVNVATQLTEDLRYEAKLENAKRADDLKRVIIEKLVDIYEKDGVFNEKINFQDDLTVMLFVGVNGVGKTTSIGKLAYKYKNEGKKVMLVAADTFRAGAVAQLVEWGRRVGVPVVTGPEKADPASVVFDGMEKAVAENVDILLIDTAGSLQNKDNLMAELEKIVRIIKRVV
ncbi:MAG: signal recognition particle receptor subunit alpha, partial [Streptococcus gallolyticus]|nr:signal recognition particle receptor subunit alpha [Streptococcus gallolyticus]